MNIPDFLVKEISNGNAVLFLGSGATKGALSPDGARPPAGNQLRDKISEHFLGGRYKNLPLHQVSEYAISESNLLAVQKFIHDIFEKFRPASFHKHIADFLWHGIATTNYDLILEKSYSANQNKLQSPVAFIENGDRVDNYMRNHKSVMFLKLHGCITRITNPSCPLILSTDQYITHRKGRSRIYTHLIEWGHEHPIVFVGHGLQDSDLRAIILELTEKVKNRPRYYIVNPEKDDVKKRYWETKKISVITGTLEDFLKRLNSEIPSSFRGIKSMAKTILPISERFIKTNYNLSESSEQFIKNDVEYVKSVIPDRKVDPQSFYKGINPKWAAIESDLDVRRQLADVILSEVFLAEEASHLSKVEMLLIKAHAGAGKTVLLQRIAWEAARQYNKLCLFLKQDGFINLSALKEIIDLCDERVYLFVDNAGDYLKQLVYLCGNIKEYGGKLTVIMAERTNEWNMVCDLLDPYLTDEYGLGYLNLKEIKLLINLLEKHRALGTLKDATDDERIDAFSSRAGRQLLVALHEATLGKSFEDIVVDEYNAITPQYAQQIYLTICVLNRLGIAVRAGIISRLHQVSISDFKEKLFKPLDNIIWDKYNRFIRDYEYRARHRDIAEMVFDKVLEDQEERYDVYVRCLKTLNVDYKSDRKAFWLMINGKTLLQLFPNHDLVVNLYKIAKESVGESTHLLHQMAIYEMHRPNGNLTKSSEYLTKAAGLDAKDLTIKHSRAELLLRLAEIAETDLQREQNLKDARMIALSIKNARIGSPYPYHTLIKISIKKIKKLLSTEEEEISQVLFENIVKEIEAAIREGLQQFPSDSYLLSEEAKFALLIADERRALKALEKAFHANTRSTFVALRLAECYKTKKQIFEAKKVLKKAINANSADKRLHYAYAKLLILTEDRNSNELIYHLRRSFTNGDKNYEAQLLYGRQLFIKGDMKYRDIFDKLKIANISPSLKCKLFYPMENVFYGIIKQLYYKHCFVYRRGSREGVFVHQSSVDGEIWNKLKTDDRVSFKIAFTMKGPAGFDLKLE